MVSLGDLSGGFRSSEAWDVSDDGSVVVGFSNSSSGDEAFRWTISGGMTGLGDLPGGGFFSIAYAVSADGSIVVGRGTSASGNQAFRWTPDTGMQRLWDVLLAQGVDPAAGGWLNLSQASGITPDGSTIVGYGTRNGNTEGFVAVVPEPGGTMLSWFAAGALLRRRRGKSIFPPQMGHG